MDGLFRSERDDIGLIIIDKKGILIVIEGQQSIKLTSELSKFLVLSHKSAISNYLHFDLVIREIVK